MFSDSTTRGEGPFILVICAFFRNKKIFIKNIFKNLKIYYSETLLRGHPDERPTPLERPLGTVNLNINVLISTPDERPPLLKGNFSGAKGLASQEEFHCIIYVFQHLYIV